MKTIKLLFTAILMMMAMCVQAQTVQVMKDGQVVKEYPAAEVASVEFETTYKYYIGAISEDDLINSSVVNNLINNSTTTSKDGMTSLPIPATNKTTPFVLFIYPTAWGTPKITYKTWGTGNMSASDLGISEAPSGYKLCVWEEPSGTPYDISWTK